MFISNEWVNKTKKHFFKETLKQYFIWKVNSALQLLLSSNVTIFFYKNFYFVFHFEVFTWLKVSTVTDGQDLSFNLCNLFWGNWFSREIKNVQKVTYLSYLLVLLTCPLTCLKNAKSLLFENPTGRSTAFFVSFDLHKKFFFVIFSLEAERKIFFYL